MACATYVTPLSFDLRTSSPKRASSPELPRPSAHNKLVVACVGETYGQLRTSPPGQTLLRGHVFLTIAMCHGVATRGRRQGWEAAAFLNFMALPLQAHLRRPRPRQMASPEELTLKTKTITRVAREAVRRVMPKPYLLVLALAAGAVGLSGCDVVVDQSPVGSASAPNSTLAPASSPTAAPGETSGTALTPSCLLAPTNGKDTRIEVTGSDSDAQCATIANLLGGADWASAGSSNGEFAFIMPAADSSTMCVGIVGSSTYKVLDHQYVNGTGDVACSQLRTAYP